MGSVPSSAPRSAGPVSVFVTQRLIGDANPPLGEATPSSRCVATPPPLGDATPSSRCVATPPPLGDATPSSRCVATPPPLGDATPSSRPASHGLCHFTESRTIDARGNTSRTWSALDPTTSTRTTYHQRPESSHLAISEECDGVGILSGSFSAVTNRWSYEQQRDLLTQVRNEAHGGVISQDDYTNDAAGRRVSQTRSGTAMRETRIDDYGYNARGELITATKRDVPGAPNGEVLGAPSRPGADDSDVLGAPSRPGADDQPILGVRSRPVRYAYQYDDIGNRIWESDRLVFTCVRESLVSWSSAIWVWGDGVEECDVRSDEANQIPWLQVKEKVVLSRMEDRIFGVTEKQE